MRLCAALYSSSTFTVACGPPAGPPETLRSYSLGSLDGVLARRMASPTTAAHSADGDGSLRIEKAGNDPPVRDRRHPGGEVAAHLFGQAAHARPAGSGLSRNVVQLSWVTASSSLARCTRRSEERRSGPVSRRRSSCRPVRTATTSSSTWSSKATARSGSTTSASRRWRCSRDRRPLRSRPRSDLGLAQISASLRSRPGRAVPGRTRCSAVPRARSAGRRAARRARAPCRFPRIPRRP